MRLAEKTAVVTGGGRGIGPAVAQTLARAGARVVVVARSASEIEAVAADLRSQARGTGSVGTISLSDTARRSAGSRAKLAMLSWPRLGDEQARPVRSDADL